MTRWQVVALLALSLWASASWLTGNFLPSQITPVAAQGIRLLLLGGLSLSGLVFRRVVFDARYVLAGVASLGLVGIPYLLLTGAQGRIASTDGVLVFALIPVMVAVLGGTVGESDGLSLVRYGLPGAAGILILLPVRLPGDGSGVLGAGMLGAAMMLTVVCLIWMGRLLRGLSLIGVLPIVCFTNGILLLIASVFSEMAVWSFQGLEIEAVRCLLIDLPETLLFLWLVKTVCPFRLSARYALAPLFTVLEGLWLVRPRFEIRTALGIGLLAAGACLILFARPSTKQTRLDLT